MAVRVFKCQQSPGAYVSALTWRLAHDDNDVLEDLRIYLAKEQSLVMDIGGTIIEVDTTDFSKVDYQAILNEVRSAMQKHHVMK